MSFDLRCALDDFLNDIGLLPLSNAASLKPQVSEPHGRLLEHRFNHDLSASDIVTLLAFVDIHLDDFNNNGPDLPNSQDHTLKLLKLLSRLSLIPAFSDPVSRHFGPILPELASRWLLEIGYQDDGTYAPEVLSDWPDLDSLDSHCASTLVDDPKQEKTKAMLRSILFVLSIWLKSHPRMFQFLILIFRHPAFARDPFTILPASLMTSGSCSNLDYSDPTHPLFQDPSVPCFLLSLYRLLSIAPHLPFPGLVKHGWLLPNMLTCLMQHHPRQGIRYLAWLSWRYWYGEAGFSQWGIEIRDQYVWKPEESNQLSASNFLISTLSAPWPKNMPDSRPSEGDTIMSFNNHLVDSLPEEYIPFDVQLTSKWDLRISPHNPNQSTVSYQTAARAIDVWVLPTHQATCQPCQPQTCDAVISSALQPRLVQSDALSPLLKEVEGMLVLRFGSLPPSTLTEDRPTTQNQAQRNKTTHELEASPELPLFVSTTPSRYAIRSLVSSIELRLPVLLSGPPSSGKHTILQQVVDLLWSSALPNPSTGSSCSHTKIVTLNLASRTLDAKSLIGSHVSSSEDPGKFVFVEGPLTRAMREGKWLVCRDIDRASDDILAIINQVADLIRRRAQYEVGGGIGGHGGEHGVGIDLGPQIGWVAASERFALLATRTTTDEQSKSFIGEKYWNKVDVPSLTHTDVVEILAGIYPSLSGPVRDCLVAAWSDASTMRSTRGSRRQKGSLRELMRWARRVNTLVPRKNMLLSVSQNPIVQETVFLDAVDIFLASSEKLVDDTDPANRASDLFIALALGSHLGLNEERIRYCLYQRTPDFILPPNKPTKDKRRTLIQIGRIKLPVAQALGPPVPYSRPFALTKSSLVLLERLANCVRSSEPILLVGETGTGKTSIVSYLAKSLGKSLVSLNLSNQSEASDLLGGFKPLDLNDDAKMTGSALIDEFTQVFGDQFNLSRNQEFIMGMRKALLKKKWSRLVTMWKEAFRALVERARKHAVQSLPVEGFVDSPSKRRKISDSEPGLPMSTPHVDLQWQSFLNKVEQFEERFVRSSCSQVRFKFVEGPLVKAMQRGDWVLLDEINLGTGETLESLGTLLSHPNSSLVLSERGDLEPIRRDPEFRLIGCMNPATDVGKRDLPSNLRCKFTEFYVQPPDNDRDALLTIISQYLRGLCVSDKRVVTDVADCYSLIRSMAQSGQLADGTNSPPHYSMRTLARALTFAVDISDSFSLRRALVEGFLMSFVTTLEAQSAQTVIDAIDQHFVKTIKNSRAVMNQASKKPNIESQEFIQVGSFWLKKGARAESRAQVHSYVLTESVKSKMIDLARAVTTGRYPVLIQGPTSSGKTSIVEYLAEKTGHTFVRINNHEHTDIQEYIGSYVTDPDTGQLCFKEGALVRALRNGEWVVLDELNLAPSDVLEALNRLLDDNRELLIPETQEVVRPHPHFMLFATQNPPGLYGGRKVLSRAFRNRFLELHFDDVPTDELEIILCERCQIAPSYSNKIVQVFTELQRRRQMDRIFDQKHSFVTLRDLFRWGERGAVGYQQLAEDGYMLLAERSRGLEEKEVVKEVLEEVMKVKINPNQLYESVALPESLVPTVASKRLFKLLSRALEFHEPVLLVGEAGSGKTSVCEAFSKCRNQLLRCINLHRNSEVGDLLGSQRPVRNRSGDLKSVLDQAHSLLSTLELDVVCRADLEVNQLIEFLQRLLQEQQGLYQAETTQQVESVLKSLRQSLALFTWKDGPLVQAMRAGDLVLLDEISLADDSVLERLNSLLEPNRSIVLAECGGATIEEMQIKAHASFEIMATMNPGGDFGKRELSPALRNRFTEIWVPLVSEPADRIAIFAARLTSSNPKFKSDCFLWAERMIEFSLFFSQSPASAPLSSRELSLRDGLAWCDFMKSCSALSPALAFVHGAEMTVLDRLGTAGFGQDLTASAIQQLRKICHNQLHELAGLHPPLTQGPVEVEDTPVALKIGQFCVAKADPTILASKSPYQYSFCAPTVAQNALRIARALQVPKSILLEGSPGVGKTSMVEALARMTGRRLRRINLSDQTDLLDLFGSDVPVEGGRAGEFAWKDAAFLDALQTGDWVLLDEMNLAPQTVLEGLNACLDHRGSVYVPELDRTFSRHPEFRVFAAQNPHHQGGSRKGLPRSLVDRFTVVFMKEMEKDDLHLICSEMAPGFDRRQILMMVDFNDRITQEVDKHGMFGSCGAPWEFNLRDIGRWMKVTIAPGELERDPQSPLEYVDMIYTGRFRNISDHQVCKTLVQESFDAASLSHDRQDVVELPSALIVGHSQTLKSRNIGLVPSVAAPSHLPTSLRGQAESLMRCLELKWLPILTGPEQSGKSTLVNYLASRSGARVRVISVHSGSDTSDLFGGFEQSNVHRNALHIIDSFYQALESSMVNRGGLTSPKEAVVEVNLRRLRILKSTVPSLPIASLASRILQILSDLSLAAGFDTSTMVAAVQELSNKYETCRFEWIDGPLVTAMKQGDWLVIENSNLCSASVLDRLNPLFEGNSELQLTERGMHLGEIVTVTPHPGFRMIMIFNPRYGELSRAMRNRGIEIAFLPNPEFENPMISIQPVRPDTLVHLKWRGSHVEEFDCPMRWAVELLTHPPTQYPLLTRLLDHTQELDHKLLSSLSRLCQSDVQEAFEQFAQSNRMSHILVGKTLDLALSGCSLQHTLNHSLAASYRLMLTVVLATCCPPVPTDVEGLQTSEMKTYSSNRSSKQVNPWTSLLEPIRISDLVNAINQMIVQLASSTLKEFVVTPDCQDDFVAICRSLNSLQVAVMKLPGLVQRVPDYASFAFVIKVIDQTLTAMPNRWQDLNAAVFELFAPFKTTFDITRWQPMVHIWNTCCPVCPVSGESQDLLRSLEDVGSLYLDETRPELRSLYFEVVASIKISSSDSLVSPSSVKNHADVARQLKEQISSVTTRDQAKSVRPEISNFDRAVKHTVGAIGVLSYITGSSRDCNSSFRQLLADSQGVSGELGALLYMDNYLKDSDTKNDHINFEIDVQALRLLTTMGTLAPSRVNHLFEPFNLVSQLKGTAILRSTACLTRLVECLTTLEDYDVTATMLKAVSRLVSSNAARLAVNRSQFPVQIIGQIIRTMEASIKDSQSLNESMSSDLGLTCATSQNSCFFTRTLDQAIRLWKLYVPDLPIDPLSVSTAEHRYLATLLSRLQLLRELLVEYEDSQTGHRSNTRINLLHEDILECQACLDALPHPAVKREPDLPSLVAIFSELKAFEAQFLATGRLASFVEEISSARTQDDLRALHSRLETFSISATGLLKRLTSRFPTFADVLRPINILLDVMIVSLSLILREATVLQFKDSLETINDFMLEILPASATIAAADLRLATCQHTSDEILRQETSPSRMPILRVGSVACEAKGGHSSSDLKLLVSAYDKVWKLWSLDRAKEEREAEERAQEFRFRRQDVTVLSDESIEAEELQTLFPTYDDDETVTMVADRSTTSNTVSSTQVDLLCTMHLAITLDEAVGNARLKWFDQLRKEIVMEIAERHGHLLSDRVDAESLAFQVNHINRLHASIGGESKATTLLDFYKDSNLAESIRILGPVIELGHKVLVFLKEWPEMIALDEIAQRCQQIARLSSESPLARIIPFVETLIGQIEEWEKYSCRENSLFTYQSIFADFVVRWRRLELASWAGLIEREMRTFDSAANVWWFRLYELLFRGLSTQGAQEDPEAVDLYFSDSATVLNDFMAECNLGQFKPRLMMLRSFSSLLRSYSTIEAGAVWMRMYHLVEGVVFFYSHYEMDISSQVDQTKSVARKEIENYIRLASWKDVNVVALRQSSHKSHRQLYKSVRRLRAVLQRPVKDALQTWQLKKSTQLEFGLPPIISLAINLVLPAEQSDSVTRQSGSSSLPSHLHDPPLALERLRNLIAQKLFSTVEVEVPAEEIKALASHVRLVVKELSEETLPKGDAKEKYARNLDLRKRKAFAHLLKRLKTLGIGSCPTDRALQRLKDPSVIFGQALLRPKSLECMSHLCEMVDDGLYGLLSQMPKFRRFRSGHHSDISHSDMQRMIGSTENGLSLILTDRKVLSSLLAVVGELNDSCARMTDLLVQDPDHLFTSTSSTSSTLEGSVAKAHIQMISLFTSALDETVESVDILRKNQNMDDTALIVSKVLQQLSTSASEFIPKLETLMHATQGSISLFKPDEIDLVKAVPVELSAIVDRIRVAAKDAPALSFLLSPLADGLSRHLSTLSADFVGPTEGSDHAWDAHRRFVDSVLVVAQQLMSRDSQDLGNKPSGKPVTGELRKGHLAIMGFSARCHMDEVLDKLRQFNRVISDAYPLTTGSQMLSNVAGFTQQYLSLLAHHLKHCLLWHQAQLDLLHTVVSIGINIGENGFCKPDLRDEDEETTGPEGPSAEGTGLGGGQGGKDVSEEIESDEQMEGLQNDVDEPDSREDGKDKEDRGVETQLEFDAPMEDVEEAEGSDSNGDDGDEDEDGADEIEDGVGKVDPLESEAVDEKFWQGEDDEKDEKDENEGEMSAKQNQPAPEDSTLAAKDHQKAGEQNGEEPNKGKEEDLKNEEEGPDTKEGPDELETQEGDDAGDEDLGSDQEKDDEGEGEDPTSTNPVPMMDHVDNSETLNLPDDLKLDESKGEDEDGMNDDEDSVMDADEPDEETTTPTGPMDDPSNDEPGEAENLGTVAPLDFTAPEPEPADAMDGGDESGAGTGGGGLSYAPSDPTHESQVEKGKEEPKPIQDPEAQQQPTTREPEGGEPQNDEARSGENSGADNDVGDGDRGGEAVSKALESGSDEAKNEESTSDPNPLRDLGDAMQSWMRRLQHIQDGTADGTDDSKVEANDEAVELEYLQTESSEPVNQQAPGPATQEQAQEALQHLRIDEPIGESEAVQRLEDRKPLPPVIDFMQFPDVQANADPVEPAISGPSGHPQRHGHRELDLSDERGKSDEAMELDPESEDEAQESPSSGTEWQGGIESDASANEIWRRYEDMTRKPALQLTEQLRLILEPTTATRLEGDYRTGKRLNMRKLVAYLASDYTKDRIWLRRTKPAQRDYQILVAVDDSRSMSDSRSAHLAFQTVALVTSALGRLEVGEIAIARFGRDFNVIQSFGSTGGGGGGGGGGGVNQGVNLVKGFSFSQPKTDVRLAIEESMKMFERARDEGVKNRLDEIWQLGIIISDGICQDHDQIRSLLRKAIERKVMFVFLILDSLHQHDDDDDHHHQAGEAEQEKVRRGGSSSIVSMNSVSYVTGSDGKIELQMERYLDSFPFDYYIILRDVEALPHVLSGTLRQFFEKVTGV